MELAALAGQKNEEAITETGSHWIHLTMRRRYSEERKKKETLQYLAI
jgi:hypothetical protein